MESAKPPEKKAKAKKFLIAIIVTLATDFELLLFVFVLKALRNANIDNDYAQKITALKTSWRKDWGCI